MRYFYDRYLIYDLTVSYFYVFIIFFIIVTVSGFVQSVLPMKRSRKGTSYFNAVIQSHDKYHQMVCFSLEKITDEKVSLQLAPIKRKPSLLKM